MSNLETAIESLDKTVEELNGHVENIDKEYGERVTKLEKALKCLVPNEITDKELVEAMTSSEQKESVFNVLAMIESQWGMAYKYETAFKNYPEIIDEMSKSVDRRIPLLMDKIIADIRMLHVYMKQDK